MSIVHSAVLICMKPSRSEEKKTTKPNRKQKQNRHREKAIAKVQSVYKLYKIKLEKKKEYWCPHLTSEKS